MKTFEQMMSETFTKVMTEAKPEDLQVGSAMRSLMEAIEVGMYYGAPKHEVGVRKLLSKLGIKSAEMSTALEINSLYDTLRYAKFDTECLGKFPSED